MREAVISAVCAKNIGELPGLIQKLAKLSPTEDVLRGSGVGHLVGDRHIWGLAGYTTQRRAAALQARWRVAVRQSKAAGTAAPKTPAKPFAGLRTKEFLTLVKEMEKAISTGLPDVLAAVRRSVAAKAVLMGYTDVLQLAGTLEEDVADFFPSPVHRAVFMQFVHNVEGMRSVKRKREEQVLRTMGSSGAQSSSSGLEARPARPAQGHASAADLAEQTKKIDPEKLQTSIAKVLEAWDVPALAGTPTAVLTSVARAHVTGKPVLEVLTAKAAAYRLEGKKSSRAQVASALRLWHQFATLVLDYDAASTLPPREGVHIEAFLGVFRNPATAGNYVSHLRWAGVHLGLANGWDTETVRATLKGAKRRRANLGGGPAGAKKLLTKKLMESIVITADAAGSHELALQVLVAWNFLMRVQSECSPLQVGCAGEAYQLPAGRHSALWVDSATVACVRLRQRKNRPQGSLLKRACSCHLGSRQLCLPHRLQDFLLGKKVGSKVWTMTSREFLLAIRQVLTCLRAATPDLYTLKMFRAGHATELAKSGKSVGDILRAGEWRSAAFLAYVDEDLVDAAQILEHVLEDSDME